MQANELTPEELSMAIDMATDQEDAQQEKEILKGIVNMSSIQVKQIMRSRVDMTAVENLPIITSCLKWSAIVDFLEYPFTTKP